MNRQKIYFGHPINLYGTPLKIFLLAQIRRHFPSFEVEDPDQERHLQGYLQWKARTGNGMDYYTEVVLRDCRRGVFLPFRDGMFGAGVVTEARWLIDNGYPIWEISPRADLQRLLIVPEHRILTVEETRERIRNPDGSRKPY